MPNFKHYNFSLFDEKCIFRCFKLSNYLDILILESLTFFFF